MNTILDFNQASAAAFELFELSYREVSKEIEYRAKYIVKMENQFDKLTPQRVDWLNKEREFLQKNIDLFEKMHHQMATMVQLLNRFTQIHSASLENGEKITEWMERAKYFQKLYEEAITDHVDELDLYLSIANKYREKAHARN